MEEAANPVAENRIEKIKATEKLSYAAGEVAGTLVWTAVSGFITYYYTDAVGISAAVAGTIFLLSRLFDGVSDILMGVLVDKTKTKYGKARPWLLWMAVPFFISTVLVFAVPGGWSPQAKIIYAFITYNLLSTIVYTALSLPYSVMNALITDDPKDRISLNVFRTVGTLFMSLVIGLVVQPLVRAVGGPQLGTRNPMAWTIVMGAIGFVSMALYLLCFKGTKERVQPVDKKPLPVKKAFAALVRNKYWYLMLAICLIAFIQNGMMGINIYYAKYWLGNEDFVGILNVVLLVPMVLGIFVSMPFIGKFGKRNSILVGMVLCLAGCVVVALNPTNLVFVVVGNAMKGLGLGPYQAGGNVMLTDVIDYGEWKSGIRSDGMVFSAASFGAKVGVGLGSAAIGWLLGWAGYNGEVAVQSEQATSAIGLAYIWVPFVLFVPMVILLLFYKLDKQIPQIREDLQTARAGGVKANEGKRAEV